MSANLKKSAGKGEGAPLRYRRSFLKLLVAAGALCSPWLFAGNASSWRQLCPITIDCHTHFLDELTLNEAEAFSPASEFGRRRLPRKLPFMQKMMNPLLHIADMDARGIDRSVLSSAAVVEGLSFSHGEQAIALNRHLNDVAADWVKRYPQRFIGSFCLPLESIDDSIAELERALSIGLRVANLPAQHRGAYLGHPRFEPLWEVIEKRGVVAFIHPDGVKDPWYQDYAMWNSIGQSIEEVRVMTSMIYEGVLERHPQLKLVMSHGGGYMPHYMGRLDRNARDKPATMANISQPPSAYLRRFHYDSCVYDASTLSALVARVGIDRVVLGGDYPVAGIDPIEFIEKVPGLSAADIAAIAGNNAARLFLL